MKKSQEQLLGESKFCSWASDNRSLVVWWAREVSLSSLVSDNFQSKTIQVYFACVRPPIAILAEILDVWETEVWKY